MIPIFRSFPAKYSGLRSTAMLFPLLASDCDAGSKRLGTANLGAKHYSKNPKEHKDRANEEVQSQQSPQRARSPCKYSSAVAGRFASGSFHLRLKERKEANTRCGRPQQKESSTR